MGKKVFAFNGSPRAAGNSFHLLRSFLQGAESGGAVTQVVRTHGLSLKDCTGCLRCNVLKRCSQSGDEWDRISDAILESDILVFASPIYFHHVPASLKRVLDRFRSFVNVRITESGLAHTPHQPWNKEFVLLLSLGSPEEIDAQPVVELFRYLCGILGEGNRLHVVMGTRLAMVNQVIMTNAELETLYSKLKLPVTLAKSDARMNRELLEECGEMGGKLAGTR